MKQCQSCGMPIKKDSLKGSNSDGSLSQTYCHLCYQNGEFCGKDCTIEEMQQLAIKGMQQKGFPKFIAKIFASRIPKLDRWKKDF